VINYFANPSRFLKMTEKLLPWLVRLTILFFIVGIYFGLFYSPADYQQGDTVRIMYVHVPAAWMALACYVFIATMGALSLVYKHPLAGLAAKSAAPIGASFTIIVIITGSLWGKPIWGAWWVWDARLSSVLVLFFLYLGHIALSYSFENPSRGNKASAILALVGLVNIPIIKFSVDWWNTLHQPASITRFDAPAIDPSMLIPLIIMALAFFLYFITVLLVRIKSELTSQKIKSLNIKMIK
tara:strand:- start:12878 stop:13597 length:720 start_codon:yes stop_codon:yes gene_type:complete